MTKLSRLLIVAGILGSMGGGAYAAWVFRDRLAGGPPPVSPARAAYDRYVAGLGGNEPTVRDDLNHLAATASAPVAPADRARADRLTRECLDPNVLLEIEHVRIHVERGELSPYHFVGDAHKQRLRAIAGDHPTAANVLAVRKALAILGDEFARIRQPPDWKVEVTPLQKGAEAPRMPFLDLLRSGFTFAPPETHPVLHPEPRVPAFAGPDGELLVQLEQFFNTPQARAALPAARYPKLYVNGRIPPIPTNLSDYETEMVAAVAAETAILLPDKDPDPEGVEAVRDVYAKLERFFTAVVQFEANDQPAKE